MAGQFIVAAAGSGKTELIVDHALKSRRALLTTYTNRNTAEIRDRVERKNAVVPRNIEIINWTTFAFRHGVAPYQRSLELPFRMRHVSPNQSPSYEQARGRTPSRNQVGDYFLDSENRIYNDRVTDLACLVNELSGGKVVRRLEQIFSHIYIDEAQDLAGWDIDFVELLARSSIEVWIVGDPRQRTYTTTNSKKNQRSATPPLDVMRGRLISGGYLDLKEHRTSHRSNQEICDFADRLYPEMPTTFGAQAPDAVHAGVFLVRKRSVSTYVAEFKPIALRWSVTSPTDGVPAFNFGESKGASFDRVLVYPTKTMLDYFSLGEDLPDQTRAKLYVALTRARHSVAIVIPEKFPVLPGYRYWAA